MPIQIFIINNFLNNNIMKLKTQNKKKKESVIFSLIRVTNSKVCYRYHDNSNSIDFNP